MSCAAFAAVPPHPAAAPWRVAIASRRPRSRPRACAAPAEPYEPATVPGRVPGEPPPSVERARGPPAPPMRWGRIPEGESCTYCADAKVVDCPSCGGEGFFGSSGAITCHYCRGRKRLACPLCVEEDPYAWTFGSESRTDIDELGDAAADACSSA